MNIEMTTANNAEYLWVVADRIRFLGGVPGSDLELLDIEVPPGSGTPPHIHESPELFYILEGELTVRQFGAGLPQVIKAGPSTSVRVPSRVPHNYSNESDNPIRMLVMLAPSMIAFFRDVGSVERPQGTPDFARIGAAMDRHGIEALSMAA
ncbi:cupin domain-containing protein [Sinorhizobium meliloti]|uniref:cupin domain-containing protein n=1 Tax=Rhizobium meliloti TaxID=382 RepID=UPI00398CC63F